MVPGTQSQTHVALILNIWRERGESHSEGVLFARNAMNLYIFIKSENLSRLSLGPGLSIFFQLLNSCEQVSSAFKFKFPNPAPTNINQQPGIIYFVRHLKAKKSFLNANIVNLSLTLTVQQEKLSHPSDSHVFLSISPQNFTSLQCPFKVLRSAMLYLTFALIKNRDTY